MLGPGSPALRPACTAHTDPLTHVQAQAALTVAPPCRVSILHVAGPGLKSQPGTGQGVGREQCPFWSSVLTVPGPAGLTRAAPADPVPPRPGSLELPEGGVLGPTWRPLRSRIQNVLPEGLVCVQCGPLPPRFLRKAVRGLLSKELTQHVAQASTLQPGSLCHVPTQGWTHRRSLGSPEHWTPHAGAHVLEGQSGGTLQVLVYQAPRCKEQNTRFPLLPAGNPWMWRGRVGSE